MKYRVHRIDGRCHNIQERIDDFFKSREGEVVSVLPTIKSIFMVF